MGAAHRWRPNHIPPAHAKLRLVITDHAVARYQERVRPCSDEEARAALEKAVRAAVDFRLPFVRIGKCEIAIVYTPVTAVIKTVLPISSSRFRNPGAH